MKKRTAYFSAIIGSICLWACDDIKESPIDHDETAPGMVSNVSITPLPGGAAFTYSLPDDPDLLCVEASYRLADGIEKKIRSSYHKPGLSVEGFADTAEYTVNLTCIDRSENRSQPLQVTFRPLTSPVVSAFETLSMRADFGGIQLNWENPGKAALAIFISAPDSLGREQIIETYYSSSETGKYNVEGLDTISKPFTVRFRDKWNNYSERKTDTLTPLYEIMLDPNQFRNMGIDYASETVGDIKDLNNLWDNNFEDHAMKRSDSPWYASWDLGVKAKISKIIIWQYGWPFNNYGQYYYGDNMRKFRIYGTDTPNDPESWTELLDDEIVKPSGLPLGLDSNRKYMTDEDFDLAHNKGHKFLVPLEKPAIRYIRLESLEAWEGRLGTPGEIQIFGDPR